MAALEVFKKILFDKTSTYQSEFRLSCNYIELMFCFNIFVWYQHPNLFVNITIRFSQHELFTSLENFLKFVINVILNYFYKFFCDRLPLKKLNARIIIMQVWTKYISALCFAYIYMYYIKCKEFSHLSFSFYRFFVLFLIFKLIWIILYHSF